MRTARCERGAPGRHADLGADEGGSEHDGAFGERDQHDDRLWMRRGETRSSVILRAVA